MNETPQEKEIKQNFLPGKISKDGFLGEDTRHIHEIIDTDLRILNKFGVTREQIAEKLQFFIDEGKKGLELPVDLGDFTVQVTWARGMLPCPFGCIRLHHKIVATVINKKLNQTIRYSQLNVHLIKEHGFFEGNGSQFRLEPDKLIEFLKIQINDRDVN